MGGPRDLRLRGQGNLGVANMASIRTFSRRYMAICASCNYLDVDNDTLRVSRLGVGGNILRVDNRISTLICDDGGSGRGNFLGEMFNTWGYHNIFSLQVFTQLSL